MTRCCLVLLLLLAAAVAGKASAAAPRVWEFTEQHDVSYGPQPKEVGDLYVPAGPRSGLRPAVIVIHGGGWINGQRSTNSWLSTLIAARGFVVFNIDYTLGEADKPPTYWPAPLADAQLAVRWLRAHAKEFQIDPARLGAVGDSAGGTLAVFLGVLDHPIPSSQAHLLDQEKSNVQAVVSAFGVMDLAALGDSASVMLDGMFGSKTPPANAVQAVSPLPLVTNRAAPMFLVHGDSDNFVPIEQSQRLLQTLQSHQVTASLSIYAGGHGFEGARSADINAIFAQEVAWLGERLQP